MNPQYNVQKHYVLLCYSNLMSFGHEYVFYTSILFFFSFFLKMIKQLKTSWKLREIAFLDVTDGVSS